MLYRLRLKVSVSIRQYRTKMLQCSIKYIRKVVSLLRCVCCGRTRFVVNYEVDCIWKYIFGESSDWFTQCCAGDARWHQLRPSHKISHTVSVNCGSTQSVLLSTSHLHSKHFNVIAVITVVNIIQRKIESIQRKHIGDLFDV